MKTYRCAKVCMILLLAMLTVPSLSACTQEPVIDSAFVSINANTRDVTTTSFPTLTQPTTTASPSNDKDVPTSKPSGFVLNEEHFNKPVTSVVTEPPTIDTPSTDEPNTDVDTPTTSPGTVDRSSLKNVLASFGRTTTDGRNFVAYNTQKLSDGGISIRHITSTSQAGEQKDYVYYESIADYEAAKEGVPEDACDDALHLILRSTTDTFPVTNPETMGCILFDGYQLWR